MRAWHFGDMNLFILPIKQAPARLDSTVNDSDTLDLEYLFVFDAWRAGGRLGRSFAPSERDEREKKKKRVVLGYNYDRILQ